MVETYHYVIAWIVLIGGGLTFLGLGAMFVAPLLMVFTARTGGRVETDNYVRIRQNSYDTDWDG